MEIVIITNFTSEIKIMAPMTATEGVVFTNVDEARKFLNNIEIDDAIIYLAGKTSFTREIEQKYENTEGVKIIWL